jgi:predicted DNA-binding transcriptional regulator YafY
MEHKNGLFQLLTILREETDAQHRMSQQQMLQRMLTRYNVKLNRRTLKRYLETLREADFPLIAEQTEHRKPDGTISVRQTGWYMEPQLELSELRLLLDLLHSVPALPHQQRDALSEKLCRSVPRALLPAVSDGPDAVVHLHRPPAKQLLFTVELLCEAIQKKCMVEFAYCRCRLNAVGEIVTAPRTDTDGSPYRYRVSPYRILVSQGRYYLVCTKAPHPALSHYRLDRIADIRLLTDTPAMPMQKAEPLPVQTIEQLYMYAGEQVSCRFLADARILGDIADWFGDGAQVVPTETEGQYAVTVSVHPQAMEHWALQYGRWVTVLEPASLRASLAEAAAMIAEKYPPETTR